MRVVMDQEVEVDGTGEAVEERRISITTTERPTLLPAKDGPKRYCRRRPNVVGLATTAAARDRYRPKRQRPARTMTQAVCSPLTVEGRQNVQLLMAFFY